MIKTFREHETHGIELSIDTKEIDVFRNKMLALAQEQIPTKTKSFLRQQARKLNKAVKQTAKLSEIKHKTGVYLKSIKAGKPFKDKEGDFVVRVYSSAPHSHLLEYGHSIFPRGKKPPVGKTRAFGIFEKSKADYKTTFHRDADRFIDEMLEKGLLG